MSRAGPDRSDGAAQSDIETRSSLALRRGSLGRFCRRGIGVLFVFAASAWNLSAQEYGRWWWDGIATAGKRSLQTQAGGDAVKSDITDLRFSGGMNGFLGHPAMGNFRVGLDVLTSASQNGSTLRNNRFGFDTRLNLMPRGAYPLRLYARRQFFNVSGPAIDDPAYAYRVPDESREWGGRFRLRKGALRGLLLGFNAVNTQMDDANSSEDTFNQQLLHWNRLSKRFNHTFRARRTARDYETSGYGIEDVSINFDERANLSPNLLWETFLSSVRSDRSQGGQSLLRLDTHRLRTRLLKRFDRGDYLDTHVRLARLLPDESPTIGSYSLSLLYRRPIGRGWEIGPFGEYATQTSNGLSLTAPRVGVTALWSRQRNALNASIAGHGSYGSLRLEELMEVREESQAAMRVNGTISHGAPTRLRKEFEFEAGRNQLRFSRDPVDTIDEITHPLSGLGTEDFFRLRGGLGRQWGPRQLSGWLQWFRREGFDVNLGHSFVADSTSGSLQYGSRKYSLLGHAGSTSVRNGSLIQEVSFGTLRLQWTPLRYLTLRGVYRADVRETAFMPNIDGRRIELSAALRIGLFDITGAASRLVESGDGTSDRTRTQYNVFIARRFAGWLPVTTGTRRRGVIR